MRLNKLTVALSLAALATALTSLLGARAIADAPAEVIATRQEGFKQMGKAMKTFRDALQSKTYDRADLIAAAAVLDDHAGEISAWFPEGSGPESGADTDALPYIWKKPEKFTLAAQELPPTTAALVAAVPRGDMGAIKTEVMAVKDACSGCHDSFRKD